MRLHEQVKLQKEILTAYQEGIADLQRYLGLPKFNAPNAYVNINDVLTRLQDTRNAATRLEMELN